MTITPDQVYTAAQLEAFDVPAYLEQLAAEPATTLEGLIARDARWHAALAAADNLAARAMKLRLDHALALEPTVPTVTRNVFSTTIVQYMDRLELLAQRVHDTAARGGARDPAGLAHVVVNAAREVLGLRAALRDGLLAHIREHSAASVANADQHARDRALEDAARKQWSRARRDLEALAANPTVLLGGTLAARMATYPEQLDEPPAGPEVTFADMIELD